MIDIFRIGSCRVFGIPNQFRENIQFINIPIGYTHSLKEHIQLIKFLRGEIVISDDLLKYIFTFYGGNEKKENIRSIVKSNRKFLEQADVYLVEVCTLKIIKYNHLYLQRSRFIEHEKRGIEIPSEDILSGYNQYLQNESDFLESLEKIIRLLNNKPIIFTGHLNVKTNSGKYIKNRQKINKMLLKYTRMQENICYYNLSGIIDKNPRKYIDEDLAHLKMPALLLAKNKIRNILKNIYQFQV